MNKIKSIIYSVIVAAALITPSASMMAWWDCCCDSLDIAVEARVAYFHPSSKKVRKIYGDGWADYQFEISKGFCDDWRIWAGVNGFSVDGHSRGYEHRHTTLQLIPINFGIKYFLPLIPPCEAIKFFIGGAGSYSFLRIKDNSDYVHRHTHKNGWGGLVEAGVNYYFCEGAYFSLFAEGFFQRFDFHDSYVSHGSGSISGSGEILRRQLDLNGYKVGLGLGYRF